jgi:uncharacterized protein (DUF1684 family)
MKKTIKHLSMIAIMMTFMITVNGQAQSTGNDDCIKDIQKFRNDRNQWMKTSPNTPFESGDLADFTSLFYFKIDCSFRFEGTLEVNSNPQEENVNTSDGKTIKLINYGNILCNISGVDYNFIVYKNIDMPEFAEFSETYFIPIKDATSGPPPLTVFALGRYLIVDLPASGNSVILDFNMAINPFENYSSSFTSLITPSGNIIFAPLSVGERKYEDRTR